MSIFTVEPTEEWREIGDAVTGVVRLQVLHGLTVAEDEMYQALTKDLPNLQQEMGKAAELIAAAEDGMTPGEAYDVVLRGMISAFSGMIGDKEKTAYARHSKTVQAVAKVYDDYARGERSAMATLMIRCRKGQTDWVIPPGFNQALLNGLASFARDEARNEIRVVVPMTDELVGKQQPENCPAP